MECIRAHIRVKHIFEAFKFANSFTGVGCIHIATHTFAWCVGRGASFANLVGGTGISDP